MKKKITWEKIILNLKNPFTVSYGSSTTRPAFWVRLENDEGWGEGTIPFYYGIDFKTMTDFWDAMGNRSDPFPEEMEEIPAWIGEEAPRPAQAGLDIAFFDRIGKNNHLPVWKILNVPEPKPMTTCFTISLDSPEKMAEMALQIPDYPFIKIKLGNPGQEDIEEARIAAVRNARPDAKIRVDANAGWKTSDAIKLVKRIEKYNLELIEQPTPKEDIIGMGMVQRETEIPVVADESVQTLEDVEKLHAAGVKGINLKLMKCGGLYKGTKILKLAKSYGMKVMLGSMIETSIGIGAMSQLLGCADWIDLDSPLLISNNPFSGLEYTQNALLIPPSSKPGIGITIK